MSASFSMHGPPEEGVALATPPGGLQASATGETPLTLGCLPVGARLVLRCRKDWRDATVMAVSPETITLSINAPSGRTYRVRRPADALLSLDGTIPLLGEGCWRTGFARYDHRW